MSSSDSDDDCYGNVVLKLQSLKNTYKRSDVTNLDGSANSASISKGTSSKQGTKLAEIVTQDENTSLNSTDDDELTLDAIIANNSKTRRGRKRKTTITTSTLTTRSVRRKTAQDAQNETVISTTDANFSATPSIEPLTTSHRGRGRSRGSNRCPRSRGGRQQRTPPMWLNFAMPDIPIFSVGNTDEYPDMCDNQPLFAPKSDDVVIIEEPDIIDDNEELSVKVYWQSCEVFKFKLRRFQKLTKLFQYFSKRENVTNDKLLFIYNDTFLKPDDTPESIDYSIAKFIDGGIVSQSISKLTKSSDKHKVKDGIALKFQCQNVKRPYETVITPKDKMALAMMQYAEHIEIPLDRLKFYFDGDLITGKSTAQELDLEGGECIDVKLCS